MQRPDDAGPSSAEEGPGEPPPLGGHLQVGGSTSSCSSAPAARGHSAGAGAGAAPRERGAAAAVADPSLCRLIELIRPVEGCAKEDQAAKVEALTGNVWRLATDKAGSYLLQDLLVHLPDCHKVVVAELQTHVNEAWQKPEVARHANHVLQKLVEILPPENCHFIRDELLRVGDIMDVAHNAYGCRILQRLIEHFQPHEMADLMNRLLEEDTLSRLVTSRYGNYVLQCILEHGESTRKTKIGTALLESDDFRAIVVNKYGSHVVQAVIVLCPEYKEQLLGRVCALDPRAQKSYFGSYVARHARSGKPRDPRRSLPEAAPSAETADSAG